MPAATARLEIQNVGGDVLELDVETDLSVPVLKQRIEAEWHIPPECQKLVAAGKLLHEGETLDVHHLGGNAPLVVTLVVSSDEVYERLSTGDAGARAAALQAIGRLAKRDREGAVASAAGCLQDSDETVRAIAEQVLAEVAERRDEGVIAELGARLEHDDPCVRAAVVRVLAQVAEKGDMRAINAVSPRLEHPQACVREAALLALAEVTERGDEFAFEAVSDLLEREDEGVRATALQALVIVADEGDGRALEASGRTGGGARCGEADSLSKRGAEAVGEELERGGDQLREAAVWALAGLAERGCRRALGMLAAHFADPAPEVSQAAVEVFGRLAERGDDCALEAVTDCLGAESAPAARLAALRALAAVAERGDWRALEAARPQVQRPEAAVRAAALQALACIAERGSAPVVDAALGALGDADGEVREAAVGLLATAARGCGYAAARLQERLAERSAGGAAELDQIAAVQALVEVSWPGDEAAVARAKALLEDPDPQMELAALQALAWVADSWASSGALDMVVARLEHPNPLTRQSVASALGRLVEAGDARVIDAAGQRMGHPLQGVRQSATQLMLRVEKGNQNAIASLGTCLEHHDWQVRRDAMRTLVQVVDKGDEHAVAMIRSKLKHPEAHVRCAAEEALRWVQTGGEGMCWL